MSVDTQACYDSDSHRLYEYQSRYVAEVVHQGPKEEVSLHVKTELGHSETGEDAVSYLEEGYYQAEYSYFRPGSALVGYDRESALRGSAVRDNLTDATVGGAPIAISVSCLSHLSSKPEERISRDVSRFGGGVIQEIDGGDEKANGNREIRKNKKRRRAPNRA